ncbi:MAG: chromate efflux transporter [Opitutales bacterium]|nr:chromate efflux transporter [Opitutales bacterium]MDG1326343.1 chromate efflux transporter [Opitutales bacterium]
MTTQKDDLEKPIPKAFSQFQFLKDTFLCSLVAFGGPEAHLGVFLDRLVQKKKYLSEKALLEWMALCSFLPGPTSTQVITAIGLEKGGRSLAILTLLVWAMPALCLMTLIALIPALIDKNSFVSITSFLAPMAAGFVGWAAWVLGRKVVINPLSFGLWGFGLAIALLSTTPWTIPLAFCVGAGLSIFLSPKANQLKSSLPGQFSVPWGIFFLFITLLCVGIISSFFTENSLLVTFERFYRYGYLVFGGGQVVVPIMQGELVNTNALLTQDEFLAGFGLVQALPGPMFSFAAYAGGLCEQQNGINHQLLSAMIAGWAIFIPGTLLLFLVHPFWGKLKTLPWAHRGLRGINAVASGLVSGVFIGILFSVNWLGLDVVVLLVSLGLLISRKLPAPLIVLIVGLIYWVFI